MLMIASLVLALVGGSAAITLSNTLGDHMVLQRDAHNPPAVVWGFGNDGTTVTTTFNGQQYRSTVSGGVWRQELPPTAAGGPYTITFVGSDSTRAALNDVLFGGASA
jgi:sialate O-acetylesterase